MILLKTAVFALLEPSLNKALSYDHASVAKFDKLNNKSLSVELTDIRLQLNIRVQERKLYLSTNIEAFDCLVRTTLKEVRNLTDASVLTQLIKQDKLELDGDLAIAQGFSSLLVENRIDWQEFLSQYLGDALAHKVAYHFTKLVTLFKRKMVDLDYTLASGLTDELAVTPDSLELKRFSLQVDDISGQVDKLSHQVSLLKARL